MAGWGVPAQRTFLMLAIIVFSYLWRLPLNGSQVLAIAAVAVLVLDPWAIISSGFWLSFGAVAVLFACSNWQGNKHSSYGGIVVYAENIKTASMWQLLITAALFPPLAMLFNEISLISPCLMPTPFR
ncbi:ComEC/Rec2 family competence protein [Paenalcaligenes niemegkensis]|nr:ComEC/Rec2 family competence protein [Paenalcaligenes niemegkensis]